MAVEKLTRRARRKTGVGHKPTPDIRFPGQEIVISEAQRDEAKAKAAAIAAAFDKAKTLKGTVRVFTSVDDVKAIPTGIIGVDYALGIGGLPRGRIVELYGPESGGKTTMALHVVAQVQRAGGTAVYIDAENALDPTYAKSLGINIDELLISQPDSGEQAFEIAQFAAAEGADIIVIDSVAALVPKDELEGNYDDTTVALHGRMMSKSLRKLSNAVGKTSACIIFINQVRQKIGAPAFGEQEATTGGRALKFYSSIRMDVRRIGASGSGRDKGNLCRLKVVKNKVAPPFREAKFEIVFGRGVDLISELFLLGVETGLLTNAGAWYYYGEEKVGMGQAAVIRTLEDNNDMRQRLRAAVISKLKDTAE